MPVGKSSPITSLDLSGNKFPSGKKDKDLAYRNLLENLPSQTLSSEVLITCRSFGFEFV